MGDAWLDKLDEISQLFDEISIDIEEKERLSRQGQGTDRIATRISRDTARMESGLRTLSDNLSKLPLSAQEKSRRERMLGQLMKNVDAMDDLGPRGNDNRSSLFGGVSGRGGNRETDRSTHPGSRKAEEIIQVQQQTMDDQDKGLDMLYESVLRQKELSHAIGDELDVQSGLLDDLEHGMENTGSSLNRQQSRVEELMESAKNSGNTGIICALSITLIILTMLVLGII